LNFNRMQPVPDARIGVMIVCVTSEEFMAAQKSMVSEFAWDASYRVDAAEDVLTPALLVYPEKIEANIDAALRLLDGDANRWRVHIKTAKLGATVRMLIERGIQNFKCATTLELRVASESGAADVLVAYPSMGANARRVREIAAEFPAVKISALAENAEQLDAWQGSRVGVFVDVNPGMNRTGIEQEHSEEVLALVRAIRAKGLEFRGLHYYDGQYGNSPEPERTRGTHAGYRQLIKIVKALEASGENVQEVITAGSPTFPCSLSFEGFRGAGFVHRISPGTIVYFDATSPVQLPSEYGFQPAVLVLARVVSRPRTGIVTCDAGHKAVSADAGVPTCVALGRPELTGLPPSEEHLPFAVAAGAAGPKAGELLYLLPRHVCPTVNNFDCALMVRGGRIEAVEKVSARGREAPLLHPAEKAIPARG
jgi:D-serine deaminase-like pyridoxal phosphate-dependent protein